MTGHTEIIVALYNQPTFEARTIEAVARNTDGERTPYSLSALRNKQGRGLAAFWNMVIGQSEADTICLLNSDTVPARRWLEYLLEPLSTPDVGAVVPSSNSAAGSSIALSGTGLRQDEKSIDAINDFASSLPVNEANEDIDVASATCLAFPRRVWLEAGKFDEDFFLYGEDSEFTWRITNKLGLRIVWVKKAYVHHYKGRSVERAVRDGEFDYQDTRRRSTRLWREKTGKDPETGKPREAAK